MIKQAIVVSVASLLLLGAVPISHTGTWRRGGDPEKAGGQLLTRREADKVEFQLECWRGAPSYNSGFLTGHFTLVGSKGIFRSEDGAGRCELVFRFSGDKVVIDYLNYSLDCGFGHAVYANGEYKRKSRKRPEFTDGDRRVQ